MTIKEFLKRNKEGCRAMWKENPYFSVYLVVGILLGLSELICLVVTGHGWHL
jgi:hypothetical protein